MGRGRRDGLTAVLGCIPLPAPGGMIVRPEVFARAATGHTRTVPDVEQSKGVNDMAADEKSKAKTEQAKGKVKEAAGRTVGNERLTAEGRAEQTKGDARQAKEKVKDAFKH